MEDQSQNEIYVPLGDKTFDWKKVVITPPTKHSFTQGSTTIEWVTSDAYYPGPNGEKLGMFFELEEQITWGINGTWPMNVPEEKQNMTNMEGYQICYSLTSMNTINEPTTREVQTKKIFDKIHEISLESSIKFCSVKREDRLVPSPTYSSYVAAKEEGNWDEFVKPVYEFPSSKVNGKKTLDKSKPERTYLKFLSKGKGPKLECNTKIYGPDDKQVSVTKYLSLKSSETEQSSKKGRVHVVMYWDGIFYGPHGQKPHGVSNRFKISEMNYKPLSITGVSEKRFLTSNKSRNEEYNDNENNENSLFQAPYTPTKTTDADFQMENNISIVESPTTSTSTTIEPTEKSEIKTTPTKKVVKTKNSKQ